MKSKIIILIICQIIILPSVAQEHLTIKSIFDKYGKQEGSVLVQLSTDILSQGSKINFYKSLIIDDDISKEEAVLSALKSDTEGKPVIVEMKKNGKIETGTYYLGQNIATRENDFILYKKKSGKITLVYLKGNFSPEQLDSELKKLKDLFIYVNNKRIKLQ